MESQARQTVLLLQALLGALLLAAMLQATPAAGATAVSMRTELEGGEPGVVYEASGLARALRPGQRICLRLREVAGGRRVARATRCVSSTGRWQRLRPVSLRKAHSRSSLSVAVVRPARSGLRVRALRIQPRRQAPEQPAPTPVPAGSPRPAVGVQFHCTWTHYTNAERDAVLDKLDAAGVTWVRIDVGWISLEYRGKRNWESWYVDKVDYCVNGARARGINVLATLWGTPGWANGNQGREVPPTNPGDYADAARWAAERYRGKVAAWEVWNEPDPWQSFWQGTTARYVDLLRAAYPAFKAGDPGAQVLLGGPSSNDDAWLRQVYALGAKPYFDVLATHPYQGIADQPPEARDDGNRWWFSHTPAVREVMVENGDAAKPLWFTEFGWSAHGNWSGVSNWQRGVTSEQQGDFLIRAIRQTQADYPYVPVLFWYKERAVPGSADVHLEGYALLDANLSERPVYGRLKSFLRS